MQFYRKLRIIGVIIYVSNLQQSVIKKSAVEHVKFYSQAISEFRTLYTKEIVQKAKENGLKISHDYLNKPDTIPLPATLSMLLGKKLGENHDGALAKLYSRFPFPWRAKTGGLRDDFAKEAWAFLNKNPHRPFYQFSNLNGRSVLRYATADLMRESCISCHNAHPQTPQKGWKLNDVRGVLEVIQPVTSLDSFAADGLQNVVIFLFSITLISILAVLMLVYYFNKNEAYLSSVIKKRTDEIQEKEQEKLAVEKQLLQSQKMESIGTLAGGIAHDFNNLLAGALGYVELLKGTVKGQEEPLRYIQNLEKVYERASKLVSSLLGFSRKGKYRNENIDINRLVFETCTLMRGILDKKTTVKTHLEDHLWDIKGDSTQILQVLTNICINAYQSMKNGGEIVIETKNLPLPEVKKLNKLKLPPSKCVTISVSDTGCGINEEDLPKIFDPFFTTKEVGKGTGLGLSSVYGIIEKHNGDITVESNLGKGSVFTLYFPAPISSEPSEPAYITNSPEGNKALKGLTILVVDDDLLMRTLFEELLETAGAKVHLAVNGEEGVKLYEANQKDINVVLLDMLMPVMSGDKCYEHLIDLNPKIKVIFCSGYAEEENLEILEKYKSNNLMFLQKPTKPNVLIGAIQDILK